MITRKRIDRKRWKYLNEESIMIRMRREIGR